MAEYKKLIPTETLVDKIKPLITSLSSEEQLLVLTVLSGISGVRGIVESNNLAPNEIIDAMLDHMKKPLAAFVSNPQGQIDYARLAVDQFKMNNGQEIQLQIILEADPNQWGVPGSGQISLKKENTIPKSIPISPTKGEA
jgi:hypothetical protein